MPHLYKTLPKAKMLAAANKLMEAASRSTGEKAETFRKSAAALEVLARDKKETRALSHDERHPEQAG